MGLDDLIESLEKWEVDTSSSTGVEPGRLTAESGRLAMRSVSMAIEECLDGRLDGIVTAPISKEAIQLAGFDFPGHTEFLAKQTAVKDFLMMLVSGDLRVALLTIHEPIARVAGLITQERILSSLNTLSDALRSDFGVEKPRIAVLGLNPHAGDGGVIGTEEIEIIKPALEAAQATGLDVAGPFPADGFFGRRGDKEFDALLAMYHDQGLAPFKALAMGAGVNVTLGLPIVRTSPDHGTAFGIAGEGVASADSMKEAILRASDIVQKRQAASS
jgi:4-hydroxythreonine-4-phosphate dehydrogenase